MQSKNTFDNFKGWVFKCQGENLSGEGIPVDVSLSRVRLAFVELNYNAGILIIITGWKAKTRRENEEGST